MIKLNKSDFVVEVRKFSHCEPSVETWHNMFYSYSIYANKTVESVLMDFKMHITQKALYDDLQKSRKKLRDYIEKIGNSKSKKKESI